jgi:hypothetical protein
VRLSYRVALAMGKQNRFCFHMNRARTCLASLTAVGVDCRLPDKWVPAFPFHARFVMPGVMRASEFGDAVHTVALARLRRRSPRRGRWLLLTLLLAAVLAGVGLLLF